jgi:hypothetical protein
VVLVGLLMTAHVAAYSPAKATATTPPHTTRGRRQRNGGKCAAPVFVTKSRADDFVESQILSALDAIEPTRGDNGQVERLTEARDEAKAKFDTALERSLMLKDPSKAQTYCQAPKPL